MSRMRVRRRKTPPGVERITRPAGYQRRPWSVNPGNKILPSAPIQRGTPYCDWTANPAWPPLGAPKPRPNCSQTASGANPHPVSVTNHSSVPRSPQGPVIPCARLAVLFPCLASDVAYRSPFLSPSLFPALGPVRLLPPRQLAHSEGLWVHGVGIGILSPLPSPPSHAGLGITEGCRFEAVGWRRVTQKTFWDWGLSIPPFMYRHYSSHSDDGRLPGASARSSSIVIRITGALT
jgi:hypothetical protein